MSTAERTAAREWRSERVLALAVLALAAAAWVVVSSTHGTSLDHHRLGPVEGLRQGGQDDFANMVERMPDLEPGQGILDNGIVPLAQFVDEEGDAGLRAFIEQSVEEQSLPFFLSGMVYDDGVIDPRDTRTVLAICLSVISNTTWTGGEGFGVFRT